MMKASELGAKANDFIGNGGNVGIFDGRFVHLALSVKVHGTSEKLVHLDQLAGDWQLLVPADSRYKLGEALGIGQLNLDGHYLVRIGDELFPARYCPDRLNVTFVRRNGYVDYTRTNIYRDPRPLPSLSQPAEKGLRERINTIGDDYAQSYLDQKPTDITLFDRLKAIPEIATLLEREAQ
jgi:hypothetical protein